MDKFGNEAIVEPSLIQKEFDSYNLGFVRMDVFPATDNRKWTGLVEHVDHDSGRFYLTHIQPSAELLESDETLCLIQYASPQGLRQFETTIFSTDQEGEKGWQGLIPSFISCLQRRSAFRVRPKEKSVALDIPNLASFEGQMIDISTLGVCLKFKGDLTPYFMLDDVLSDCVIPICENGFVHCRLQIKRIDYDDENGTTELAGPFVGLDHDQKQVLKSYIIECQRHFLKNRMK